MNDFARDSAKLEGIGNVNVEVKGRHVPIWEILDNKLVLKETHKFKI